MKHKHKKQNDAPGTSTNRTTTFESVNNSDIDIEPKTIGYGNSGFGNDSSEFVTS